MKEYGGTLPPVGHVRFCTKRPHECAVRHRERSTLRLTRARWNELNLVNRAVNTQVRPTTDLALYGRREHWAYPTSQGDCEDYVLLKRLTLIKRGWPADALLITVVRDQEGAGHAVLTVTTDRGDFILDNKVGAIKPWTETTYRYLKRQSRSHPARWVALDKRAASTRVRLFGGLGN